MLNILSNIYISYRVVAFYIYRWYIKCHRILTKTNKFYKVFMIYDDDDKGIKSSLIKLILAQINFAYIVSISFVAFEKQKPLR